ncbi:MAG: hypothetical protein HY042_12485, partial [Spirochaetia bacterium]|nr:hypothetical protein [Spirochaetia bacterium]
LKFEDIGVLEASMRRIASDLARAVSVPASRDQFLVEITTRDLSSDLIAELDMMEPFGAGNPEPVFVMKGVYISEIRRLSQGLHSIFKLKNAPRNAEGVVWRRGEEFSVLAAQAEVEGKPITLTGGVELSYFAGRTRVRFRVETFALGEPKGVKSAVADVALPLIPALSS